MERIHLHILGRFPQGFLITEAPSLNWVFLNREFICLFHAKVLLATVVWVACSRSSNWRDGATKMRAEKKNSEGGGVGDEGEVPSSLPLFFLIFLCSLISGRTPQTERLEQAMVWGCQRSPSISSRSYFLSICICIYLFMQLVNLAKK